MRRFQVGEEHGRTSHHWRYRCCSFSSRWSYQRPSASIHHYWPCQRTCSCITIRSTAGEHVGWIRSTEVRPSQTRTWVSFFSFVSLLSSMRFWEWKKTVPEGDNDWHIARSIACITLRSCSSCRITHPNARHQTHSTQWRLGRRWTSRTDTWWELFRRPASYVQYNGSLQWSTYLSSLFEAWDATDVSRLDSYTRCYSRAHTLTT